MNNIYDISVIIEYLKSRNKDTKAEYKKYIIYEMTNGSVFRLRITFSDGDIPCDYILNKKDLLLFLRNKKIDKILQNE